MSRGPFQHNEEGTRGVALSLSNAVFSKLIKLGRELGKTPQRMAQELFDEAYAARCMGKSAAGQVAAAGAMADALEEDLQQQLAEARDQVKQREAVIAGKDRQLLDQAAEIREMREAAKGQLVVVNQASEILKREAEPARRLAPVDQDAGEHEKIVQLKRLIRAKAACGLTPRAIARELGLPTEAVRQALA
ncbi:hypothetical protein [Bosea minatitlanensis]|uniref:hypothetical protein n=1 Tax=Bosea minatitlanensis TaxID=128782 RepID=UPI0021A94F48|nr:hypothetical protein [Bosea minatitlanensis]MCT4496058.1 hypothetical protein [Bosea minatitlanensis]